MPNLRLGSCQACVCRRDLSVLVCLTFVSCSHAGLAGLAAYPTVSRPATAERRQMIGVARETHKPSWTWSSLAVARVDMLRKGHRAPVQAEQQTQQKVFCLKSSRETLAKSKPTKVFRVFPRGLYSTYSKLSFVCAKYLASLHFPNAFNV